MEHFINYYVSQNLINVAKTFSEIGILKSFVQGLSHLKPIPTYVFNEMPFFVYDLAEHIKFVSITTYYNKYSCWLLGE